ncbi:hypothetical protein QP166_00570 [Sphingomonas sp. LR60]|uniref:hypothetical protein n=1 Tax=Sphingomonas sp. LR60 TaxID=3050233 RepID=UPI002FE1D49B
MMARLRAFDDERLNADLAAILRGPDGIDAFSSGRRRAGLAKALRSPAASATIGVSLFLAMLGTTAFLMYQPRTPAMVEAAPAPAPAIAAQEAAPASSETMTAVATAEPEVAREALPRPRRATAYASRTGKYHKARSQPRKVASVETITPPAVVKAQREPDISQPVDLAQNIAPPVQSARADTIAAPTTREDVGPDRQAAQARRESVAAIRALRREW